MFYLGELDFNLFIHLLLMYRYSSRLENDSYRTRSGDFLFFYFLLYGSMIFIAYFGQMLFVGRCASQVLVYVWSRKHFMLRLNVFGAFNIRAPYFPYFLMLLGFVNYSNMFYHLIGLALGHIYYFFDDVVPGIPATRGFRMFSAPPLFNKVCKTLGMECTRELVLEEGDFIRDDEWDDQ